MTTSSSHADIWLLRGLLVIFVLTGTALLQPWGLAVGPSLLCGALFSTAIILFELRLRQVPLQRLLGAAMGSLLGIVGAFFISLILGYAGLRAGVLGFTDGLVLLTMGYIGLALGAAKGDMLNLAALGGIFGGDKNRHAKLLDTSAIIDGRICELAATGFLEGPFLVPQYVLHALQAIADSADSGKRSRGRRGRDVLQQMQKSPGLELRLIDDDCPQIKQVDHKLIAAAQQRQCKIVTTDFNLNKLAKVQQVEVLNVNEAAQAVKAAVLPGEVLRVAISREGKEAHQGVGYLEDGTMVVVDHARRLISRTVEVTVTSVLQTTAGKMIFGRLEDRAEPATTTEPHPWLANTPTS